MKMQSAFIIILIFSTNLLFGQEDSTTKYREEYLIFENFPVYNNIKDQKMSNLLYSGAGLGFANSSEDYRENWRFRLLHVAGTFTYMQPYTKTSQVFNPRVDLGFWAYYDLSNFKLKVQNHRFFAGAGIYLLNNFKINPELGNSLAYAELIPFIQIPLWHETDIKIRNRDFVLFSKIDFPVYGYLFRIPAFSLPGLDIISGFHAPFWKFQRVNLEVGLQRQLKNLPNKWRFSYQWEFYHFKQQSVYHNYSVYHYLKLSWLLRRK